jgi:cell division protein FtsQ
MVVRSHTARLLPPALPALPGDVRLMNLVSGAVFVGVALALLAAGVGRLARAPLFEIAVIQVQGDLTRNSVPTIRANALPALAGNFFAIDLGQAQRAFEQVPWVRRAVVRRVWPNRLVVELEEHQAAALWDGGAGTERLVNTHGELFEANLGDVEDEELPRFAGPDGSSARMLALWQRLRPAFAERGFAIASFTLSGRGSWRAELDDGAVVVLGRGDDDELVARAERFLRTLAQVRGRWDAELEYADLRHADGYALRLRGLTTAPARGGPAGARLPVGAAN